MTRRLDAEYADGSSSFRFTSPRDVLYGAGAATQFRDVVDLSKGPVLFVTDSGLVDVGVVKPILDLVESVAPSVEVVARDPHEPLASEMDEVGAAATRLRPSSIVAVGGGATMDTAKVARVLAEFGGSVRDYEGMDLVPRVPSVPLIAFATTSGTGSETGYGAVFTDEVTRTKRFVGSRNIIPDLAVVDPLLTLTVPPRTTGFTGLDALAQAIGPYLSPLRHPLTDILSAESVRLILLYLLAAYRDGSDVEARTGMAYGSLMMGLAMNNAECIGEHFFAEVVGPRYGMVHGHSVGVFLPYIIQFNRRVSADRLVRLANNVLGEPSLDPDAAIDQLIESIQQLLTDMAIPPLSEVGVREEDLPELADRVGEHIGIELGLNPRPMAREDCLAILRATLHGTPALELDP